MVPTPAGGRSGPQARQSLSLSGNGTVAASPAQATVPQRSPGQAPRRVPAGSCHSEGAAGSVRGWPWGRTRGPDTARPRQTGWSSCGSDLRGPEPRLPRLRNGAGLTTPGARVCTAMERPPQAAAGGGRCPAGPNGDALGAAGPWVPLQQEAWASGWSLLLQAALGDWLAACWAPADPGRATAWGAAEPRGRESGASPGPRPSPQARSLRQGTLREQQEGGIRRVLPLRKTWRHVPTRDNRVNAQKEQQLVPAPIQMWERQFLPKYPHVKSGARGVDQASRSRPATTRRLRGLPGPCGCHPLAPPS